MFAKTLKCLFLSGWFHSFAEEGVNYDLCHGLQREAGITTGYTSYNFFSNELDELQVLLRVVMLSSFSLIKVQINIQKRSPELFSLLVSNCICVLVTMFFFLFWPMSWCYV